MGLVNAGAFAGWRDWVDRFKGHKRQSQHSSGSLDSRTVVRGLKEALRKGSGHAVRQLGQFNGFYSNDRFRIPLPPNLHKLARVLKRIGLKRHVRRFEKRMNRGAEQAVAQVGPIFYRAIRNMTVRDALNILRGPDDAATRYFQRETQHELAGLIRPVVRREMSRAGVVKAFNKLKRYDRWGGASRFNLEEYITSRAIESLFTMIAEQESAIRRDPVRRTTSLLRRVFGRH